MVLTGTPGTDDAPAVLEIKWTATDPLGASASVYFTLTVEEAGNAVGNANSPPSFTSGAADQTATEGKVFSYTVPEASDPDKDALTYTAALTNGNALPEWLSFAAGTRTFSGTPDADDAPAALDITVTATDDGDPPESGTTSFTLTVKAANTAPTFGTAATDPDGHRRRSVQLHGSDGDGRREPDPDLRGGTDGRQRPAGLAGLRGGHARVLGHAGGGRRCGGARRHGDGNRRRRPGAVGHDELRADRLKGSPPTADAGSDVEGKRGETGVVLDGSGTPHADGSQSLTYQWSIDGASHSEFAGLSSNLGGAGSAKATFTVPRRRDVTDGGALDDGNWIDFELTVTDGDSESASDAVRLTIRGSTWVAVQVGAADAEAEESSGGIDFSLTLDKAARDAVSIDWATADGTATAGTDFTAASGTLTFAAGETSKTVTVVLLDDAIDEGKETFTLQLSNPQPAGDPDGGGRAGDGHDH